VDGSFILPAIGTDVTSHHGRGLSVQNLVHPYAWLMRTPFRILCREQFVISLVLNGIYEECNSCHGNSRCPKLDREDLRAEDHMITILSLLLYSQNDSTLPSHARRLPTMPIYDEFVSSVLHSPPPCLCSWVLIPLSLPLTAAWRGL
jgi:hypothetical protein